MRIARRRSLPWKLLTSLAALSVALYPNLAIAQTVPARYSGADLFRGLYLGQGPVAELFPEIWSDVEQGRLQAVPPEKLAEVEHAISDYADAIVERIAEADPDFLDDFEADVQSGNHLLVEEAVLDGAYKLIDIIAADLGVTPEELQPFDPTMVSLVVVVFFVAAAAAVTTLAVAVTQLFAAVWAVSVVAVYHFVAAVDTHVGVRSPRHDYPLGHSSLPREVWIDLIATRLAT